MSDVVRPIRPSEVEEARRVTIPEAVFAAFNTCIANKWRNGRALVLQDEVIAEILRRMPDVERHTIFHSGWLDVEGAYRDEGWTVVYDRPGYNESYAASFVFSARSKP